MNILLPFIIAVISILVCYGVGHILLGHLRVQATLFFDLFFSTVVGMSLFISAYATIATHGHTALLLLPIFIAGVCWFYREPATIISQTTPSIVADAFGWPKALGMLLLGLIIFFTLRAVIITDPVNSQIKTTQADYVFYSKLTYSLNVSGVETPIINPLPEVILNAQPYHYFDLWAGALLAKITSVPAFLLLNSVVYSILMATLFFGFAAIYKRYIAKWYFVLPLSFLSVCISGAYRSFFPQTALFQKVAVNSVGILAIAPKSVALYLLLVLGLYLLLEAKYLAATCSWAAIALVYTVGAPVICVGGSSLIVYLFLRRRITGYQAIASLGIYLLAAIWIGSFYWLAVQNTPKGVSYAPSYWQFLPKLRELPLVIKTFLGILVAETLFFAPYFLLIATILFFNKQARQNFWQRNEVFVMAFVLIMLAGVSATALLIRAIDGIQVGVIVFLPLLGASIATMTAIALQNANSKWLYTTLVVLGVLFLHNLKGLVYPTYTFARFGNSYNKDFVRQVKDIVPSLSRYGAIYQDSLDYQSVYSLNSSISDAGGYVALVRDNTPLVSLSIAGFDRALREEKFKADTATGSHLVRAEPIVQFIRQQRRAGIRTSTVLAQREFILKHGINFICLGAHAQLPPPLQGLVKRNIIDPVSGQQFCLLAVQPTEENKPLAEQQVTYVW